MDHAFYATSSIWILLPSLVQNARLITLTILSAHLHQTVLVRVLVQQRQKTLRSQINAFERHGEDYNWPSRVELEGTKIRSVGTSITSSFLS